MDNSDLTPPKAQSLSDEKLELALEEAKNQGDGMIAAMVLLEQEAQLREEDERAYAAWVERLTNDPRPEAKAALALATGKQEQAQPIEVVPVEITSLDAPAAEVVAPVVEPERIVEPIAEPAPVVEPEPIPAPVSQEAAFDELLALGSDAATDSISTLTDDFSVTGVVEQIVEKVETDFSASADEDATALEESAHSPVAAFEPEISKPAKQAGRYKTAFAVFWNQIGFYAVAIPLVITAWAANSGASVATVLTGSLSGLLIAFGLNLIAMRASSRSTKTHSLTSRSTFGVYGNILPTIFNLGSRVAILALLVTVGVAIFDSTISGAVPFASAVLPGFSLAALLAVSAVVIAAVVLSVAWLRKYLVRVSLSAALIWICVAAATAGFAQINFGSVDAAGVLLIALVLVAFSISTVGLGHSNTQLTGSELSRTSVRVASLLASVVIPTVIILVLSVSVLNLIQGRLRFDSTALFGFISVSPTWLATSALWVLIPSLLVLLAQTVDFAAESIQGFFVSRAWVRIAIVATLTVTIVVCGQLVNGFSAALASSLILALLGPAIWAGAYLTQSLMRQGEFHEVSLMRSYAFYKPVSVFALFGYVAILGFGVGITDVSGLAWTGFLNRYLDTIVIFGNFSGIVLGFFAAAVWTLVTSLPRVRKQEREVAAVDERRSEIAGVELPE